MAAGTGKSTPPASVYPARQTGGNTAYGKHVTLEDDDDLAAMQATARGDAAAFERVVRRHRAEVFRLVRRFTSNDADADDLTQQSFMRAHGAADAFRGESTVRTWLHRIAVNVAMTARRAAGNEHGVSMAEVELITNALGTARVNAREVARKLADALDRLPPKQRLVVELRLLRELSFREVAELADCSEESARVNFQHGVKKLREWVTG